MLSEELLEAIERTLTVKGFDLSLRFSDMELWDEAIFFTQSILSAKEAKYTSLHHTFKVEYLLENGNLISITFSPSKEKLHE